MPIHAIPDICDVAAYRGAAVAPNAAFDLLIEVPHGADREAHYLRWKEQLRGALPADLEEFFFINTDVGAWDLGVAVAEQLVARDPARSVLLIRCLIPRTLIDTNRVPAQPAGELAAGGMTPGLPPYVRDAADHDLLRAAHAAYTAVVEQAMTEVCGAGGLAFVPHTYGPVTMGIERVDDDIVRQIRWACSPEQVGRWPVRAEVDVIHRTGAGDSLAPSLAVEGVVKGYKALGIQVVEGESYYLHESTMGYVWSSRHPGRVLSLEVRRDLLVDAWMPFAEMTVRSEAAARFAGPIVDGLLAALAHQVR
jgi:hypothetical protein